MLIYPPDESVRIRVASTVESGGGKEVTEGIRQRRAREMRSGAASGLSAVVS